MTKTRPRLLVIAAFHNMAREAARTLAALAPDRQRDVDPAAYRVLALDNGSATPLDPAWVAGFGENFALKRVHPLRAGLSPIAAINDAVRDSAAEAVMILIDGAHIPTPGMVAGALRALAAYPDPFVVAPAFHLGPQPQGISWRNGYDQAAEDALLATVPWRENGYSMFLISSPGDDHGGWFGPLHESNCFALRRDTYLRLGGYDELFSSPGGGLVNLDFFRRAVADPALDYVTLLGEASFHQIHRHKRDDHPHLADQGEWDHFHEEYVCLRGEAYAPIARQPILLGDPPVEALAHLKAYAELALERRSSFPPWGGIMRG